MTVVAHCLRCGGEFTAADQDAMGARFAAHQADTHPDVSPMLSYSQLEDPAVTEAARVAEEAAKAAQVPLDANAVTMTERAAAAIGNLETAAQNWATLTAAQKDQALKLTVQVVIRLTRLMLRRLDAAP